MAQKVARTRNLGTQTEAAYWGGLRSALRQKYRYWKPAIAALNAGKRPSKSANKRLKHEYQCCQCRKWFPRKEVEINHKIPCGSLRCALDVAPFLERLTPESPDAYDVRCKACHQKETNKQRKNSA